MREREGVGVGVQGVVVIKSCLADKLRRSFPDATVGAAGRCQARLEERKKLKEGGGERGRCSRGGACLQLRAR